MKVFKHTRNKRNLFFKPDRPDRFYRDRLLTGFYYKKKMYRRFVWTKQSDRTVITRLPYQRGGKAESHCTCARHGVRKGRLQNLSVCNSVANIKYAPLKIDR